MGVLLALPAFAALAGTARVRSRREWAETRGATQPEGAPLTGAYVARRLPSISLLPRSPLTAARPRLGALTFPLFSAQAFAQQEVQSEKSQKKGKVHLTYGTGKGPKYSPGHVFYVIPAYEVSYLKNVPPLTPQQKFDAMFTETYDWQALAMGGLETLFEHTSNGYCGYGPGWGGYGKCYASAQIDGDDSGFWGDYVFPVWFHEDPRYFRLGEGHSFAVRFWYALDRTFIARSDLTGRPTFAWAPTLGTILAAVASNTYYPNAQRGVGLTASRIEFDLIGTATFNLEAEFWPDIRNLF
ncbi:MAG: hypothetical protein ACRD2E_02350 [Terriglobales bacterium]